MATKTDNDQQSAIDQGYSDGFDGGNSAYTSAGIDQLEAMANDPSQHKDESVKDAEESPSTSQNAQNSLNYTGGGNKNLDQPKLQKALGFAKKRGGIIGLISLFGIGGGILAGFFGPASLLINLTENFSLSNDSSSVAMERRMMKVLGNMTNENGGDAICANKKNIKCKMGKISNKALRQLNKKGVTAIFDGGTSSSTRYDGKRTGYPQKNPSHYEFDMGNGKKARVAAKDLTGFLANRENRKMANKVLGRSGAFNLRVKAWTGKHITQKFFNKFKIKRNGGLADGSAKKGSVSERLADTKNRLKEKIPGAESASATADKVKGKIEKQTGKAKKGGVAYLIAVGGCIAVKAPGYIAAGVAAIQLAQLLPIVMDVVMSPGSKAKASGVDTENSITTDDADAIGTLLTNKTENTQGNMTSALDSPYLLAAMGVNKSKPGVSQKFAPGFSLLSNPVVREANKAEQASEGACNVIMSPTAMYTAMAADMAVTVAASATIIGGLIKIAASWIISELISELVKNIAGDLAIQWITEFAQNDAIEKAEGEELGDVIGISAAAFFSAGGMSRHLPTLSVAQLDDFTAMQQESENFQREMDIASLSPFDTSSRYTFLGSIIYSSQMAVLANGGYGASSVLSSIASLPSLLVSNAGAATNFSSQYCGYADDYYLDTEDKNKQPAINLAGLPCTGITPTQANMSPTEAIDLLGAEGWICTPGPDGSFDDDCPEIPEGATIEDLMPKSGDNEDGFSGNGFIKPDNLLYEFIASCGDASSGDYIFNAGGCIPPSEGEGAGGTYCLNGSYENDDGETVPTCALPENDDGSGVDSEVEGVDNPRAIQAISVFLLDYQVVQILNGEDEEEGGSNSPSVEGELVGDKAYPLPKGSAPANTYANHGGIDFPVAKDTPIFAVADGVVERAVDGCTQEHGGKGTLCKGTGWGNYVRIKHSDSVDTLYAHMTNATLTVKSGDTVKAGQQIGGVGSTGSSTGYHLHFEVYVNGTRIGDTGAFNWLKQYNILPIDQDSLNW